MLTGVLIGLWAFVGRSSTTVADLNQPAVEDMTPEEIARAVEEARLVLGLTGSALRRAERAAVEQVLGGEVAPALQRLPIQFSRSKEPRRSGT